MPANPLRELQRLGQSPWHDNISRGLLRSGALRRMIEAGDVTGLTSNPTIFEQAIGRGGDYDAAIRRLARRGLAADAILDALAVSDIRAAADLFAPVFSRTQGGDGYVSIEVAPRFAADAAATVDEARRLWRLVRRRNLMIKIPATAAGLAAIAAATADGINVNATLIFSVGRYGEVAQSYLEGIERRLAARQPLSRVASVASFFVSRVDAAVDRLLDERIAAGRNEAAALKGRAGIANAALAYRRFREIFAGDRFDRLRARGARLQRPLWASTAPKSPHYGEVYYVEALVGPDTVDTMPPATLAAYRQGGRPEIRLDDHADEARRVMDRLAGLGIDMDDITRRLESEGLAAFARSHDALLGAIDARRTVLIGG